MQHILRLGVVGMMRGEGMMRLVTVCLVILRTQAQVKHMHSLHSTLHPCVQVLDISDNRLSSLPEEMGEALPGLQELRLDRNRLMSLPGSFSGLSQLQVLTADGNRLSQVRGWRGAWGVE